MQSLRSPIVVSTFDRVCAEAKEAMIAALRSEPKFSELFMAHLLTRNSRVEEDLIDELFNSSEKRLARLLLLLAHFGKEGIPQPILSYRWRARSAAGPSD